MKNTPYNVMRHSQWEVAPRDPVSIGTAIIQAFGGSAALAGTTIAFGITVAGVVGYAAVTLVTSWALRALAPKPPSFSLGSQGILVNTREPAAPHQFVYGQVRKGGTITFMESTGDKNEYLHMIVCLAGHPVEEVGDIYIDDQIVTWDESTGNVTDAFLDGDDNPTIRIRKFDGTQTAAPSELLNESELEGEDALTEDFVGHDIAYLYIRLKYDQNAYPNGIPLFTAVVKGKKVYDPRTDTTAWTDNAALCIRDYIQSEYGLADTNTDDTDFSVAANISYEDVAKAGSGTVKRYTMNGIITADIPHGEVLNRMVTACAGTLFWGTGNWKLTVADYVAPTKTLTLDDLRSPISVQTRTNLRDQFNIVQGTFINADNRWITQDYPPIVGSAFVTEDNNVEQPLDLELPFTTNSPTAQRLAKLTLFRGREQATISAEFGMNAFDVEVGEIIELTIDRYGWTAKEFEVIGWQLKASEDAGDLRVMLTLRETSEAAFDWNAEEAALIANDTQLPVFNFVDAPTSFTLTNVGYLNSESVGDGTFVPSVLATWAVSSDSFVSEYELEWKKSTDTEYNQTTTTATQAEISPLEAGVTYNFRVRARNIFNVKSAWVTSSILTEGDTTAPSAPTLDDAVGGYNTIALFWTNPSDKDFKQVRVFRNTTNNSASATLVAVSAGSTYIDGALPASTTRYYWVKAEDFSGNISGFSNGRSATTNAQPIDGQPGADGENARGYIISNAAHTVPAGRSGVVESYAGSGTDIEVLDGTSRLSWISSGTPTAGQFTFSAITVSPAAGIVVGARTGIPAGVRVADHSGMSVTEDVVTITFTITGRTFDNVGFTLDIVQSITKSSAGADGAGRWNIPVASLPTTSAQAQTAWDAASIGRDPVESDQAWFYTGTESNPTAQSVWIYDSGTDSWNEQEEVIDGDLLVTGTVTADKVETDFIDAFTINANNITTGTLNADRINIDNVTIDTDGSGKLIVKTAGVDSNQLALYAASELRFDKDTGAYTIPVYPAFDWSARVTFTHDPNTQQILVNFTARANLSVTGGYGFASVYLVRKENGTVVESQQLQNAHVGTQNASRSAANYIQSYISRSEVYTPPAAGVVTEIEIRFTSLQSTAVNPDFFLDESYLEVLEVKR